MERYKWTTDEIDQMAFHRTIDILSVDMEEPEKPELKYIDEVFGS